MSLTAKKKQQVMKDFATKPNDTGSPEVQIALLTERINGLLPKKSVKSTYFTEFVIQ